jgi:hypothetical protein
MENANHAASAESKPLNGVEQKVGTDDVKRSEYKKCTVHAQRITVYSPETLDESKAQRKSFKRSKHM